MKAVKGEIPTINIQPWLDGSNPDDVVNRVRDACVTYGFFQLVGHGVPLSLQHEAFACARRFFSLPMEQKILLAKDPISGRGYEVIGSQALQAGEAPDQKEARRNVLFKRAKRFDSQGLMFRVCRLCALEEKSLPTIQSAVPTYTDRINGRLSWQRKISRSRS